MGIEKLTTLAFRCIQIRERMPCYLVLVSRVQRISLQDGKWKRNLFRNLGYHKVSQSLMIGINGIKINTSNLHLIPLFLEKL